jgi:hypothetical protein
LAVGKIDDSVVGRIGMTDVVGTRQSHFGGGKGLGLGNPEMIWFLPKNIFLRTRHSRQRRLSLVVRKMALTVSSHECRDRRAGGSFKLGGTEEVRKVWGSVVRDNHLLDSTLGPGMVVCNLG